MDTEQPCASLYHKHQAQGFIPTETNKCRVTVEALGEAPLSGMADSRLSLQRAPSEPVVRQEMSPEAPKHS